MVRRNHYDVLALQQPYPAYRMTVRGPVFPMRTPARRFILTGPASSDAAAPIGIPQARPAAHLLSHCNTPSKISQAYCRVVTSR